MRRWKIDRNTLAVRREAGASRFSFARSPAGMGGDRWRMVFFVVLVAGSVRLLETLLPPELRAGDRATPRVKRSADLPIRFRYDGTFKILQVADLHYGMGQTTRCRDVLPSEFAGCSDRNSSRFLRRMIREENPDLIVFTGDNIFGSSSRDAAESLFAAFAPAMDSELPWAAILGNHDQESTMSRSELMSFISLMDYSLAQVNPPIPTGRPIDGFGNYNLAIHGAAGSALANSSLLNLYFLDSGDRELVNGRRTYGWIKESQLCWLRSASEQLQGCSPLAAPALAFFHIPIPEVRDLWFGKFTGQYQEAVACSAVNSGVLKTLVSVGDVKGAFMGHDHLNDFCGDIDGIMFCYGGGFGYHGYGKAGWPRRARVILSELSKSSAGSWAGVKRILTWKRLDDRDLTKIDEQLVWAESPLPVTSKSHAFFS